MEELKNQNMESEMACPNCGASLSEGLTECPNCGVPLQEVVRQPITEAPTSQACPNCGTPLAEGLTKCPNCGIPLQEMQQPLPPNPAIESTETAFSSGMQNPQPILSCPKCGTILKEGQMFCPHCGAKADGSTPQKKSKKKVILPVILAALVIVGGGTAFALMHPSVEEIILSEDTLEMEANTTKSISYTISPEKAADRKVTWESSNEGIAFVNENGKIEAVKDGSCTITVSVGGKSDSISIKVETGPDFNSIFKSCSLDSGWATVGSDGSYLSIDSNPYDIDDFSLYTVSALNGVESVNEALGLPDSLFQKMGETNSLDGRQTETYDHVTVSWKYHPDNGLEVTYEKR